MKYNSNMSFEEVMRYYELGALDISREDLVRVVLDRTEHLEGEISLLREELSDAQPT